MLVAADSFRGWKVLNEHRESVFQGDLERERKKLWRISAFREEDLDSTALTSWVVQLPLLPAKAEALPGAEQAPEEDGLKLEDRPEAWDQ